MDFHDAVHISDLKLPQGCRPTETKGDATIVTIVPPSVLPEEDAGRERGRGSRRGGQGAGRGGQGRRPPPRPSPRPRSSAPPRRGAMPARA